MLMAVWHVAEEHTCSTRAHCRIGQGKLRLESFCGRALFGLTGRKHYRRRMWMQLLRACGLTTACQRCARTRWVAWSSRLGA